MLTDFAPDDEPVIVRLLGAFEGTVPPGSFVRKGEQLDKLEFTAPRGTSGITRIEIRDDGRFEVTVKNVDLSGVSFADPATFSLVIGNELFEQAVQLDEDGRFEFDSELISDVEDLIDDVVDLAPDPLAKEQVDRLVRKLEEARRDLEWGHTKEAVRHLEWFIEEITRLEARVAAFDGEDLKEDAQYPLYNRPFAAG